MTDSTDPIVNQLNAPFWEAAERGVLSLPYCPAERSAFWPPSPISPFSGGPVEWRDAAPHGVLRSLVVYRRTFLKAFDTAMPYAIGLVRLDAGPQLQVHVRDPDGAAPRIGDRVTLGFEPVVTNRRRLLVARAAA